MQSAEILFEIMEHVIDPPKLISKIYFFGAPKLMGWVLLSHFLKWCDYDPINIKALDWYAELQIGLVVSIYVFFCARY